MSYRLIVGLGNPGCEYDQTRHNVGFRVLDTIVAGLARYQDERGPSQCCKVGEVRFIKPLTYMNRSGEAVSVWMNWLKYSPSDLLVIVDDVTLPLGQLRFRQEGTHGGHNGLRSISERLATDRYARLRCGVGLLPQGVSLERFVLSRFAKEEEARVQEMIVAASTAFQCCQREGIAVAMQVFNTKLKEKSEEKR